MAKYSLWVPAHCTVRVELELEKDIDIETLSLQEYDELKKRIYDEGEIAGSLCNYCGKNMEFDDCLDLFENVNSDIEKEKGDYD